MSTNHNGITILRRAEPTDFEAAERVPLDQIVCPPRKFSCADLPVMDLTQAPVNPTSAQLADWLDATANAHEYGAERKAGEMRKAA